jgi:hypothetical protein
LKYIFTGWVGGIDKPRGRHTYLYRNGYGQSRRRLNSSVIGRLEPSVQAFLEAGSEVFVRQLLTGNVVGVYRGNIIGSGRCINRYYWRQGRRHLYALLGAVWEASPEAFLLAQQEPG